MAKPTIAQLRSRLHFSASALKTFLQCPWKFRLQYVEGAPPEFRPAAMVLGRAVHVALATHHRALQDGQPIPLSELQDQADAALDREARAELPIRFKDGEDIDSLRTIGRQLVEVYQQEARPRRIIEVENVSCLTARSPVCSLVIRGLCERAVSVTS